MKQIALKAWSLLTLVTMTQLGMAGITQPLIDKLTKENAEYVANAFNEFGKKLSSDPDCLVGGFKGVVTQATPIAARVTTEIKQPIINSTKGAQQVLLKNVATTAEVSKKAINSMTTSVKEVADVSKEAIGAIAGTTTQVATQIEGRSSVGQAMDKTNKVSQSWLAYAKEKLLVGLNSQAGIKTTATIGTIASLANAFHRIAQYGRENQEDIIRNREQNYQIYIKNWLLAGMSGLSAYVLQNPELLEKHPYLCAIPIAITAADIVLQKNKWYPYRNGQSTTISTNATGGFSLSCIDCNKTFATGTTASNNATLQGTVSCSTCTKNRSKMHYERVARGLTAAAMASVVYRLAS